jgi:RNA polymerase sigma-70 factor (ECF subfamily)
MNDTSAFEAFVYEHQDRVFGIAVRLLGDESEAEDVSQIVFLKAFERFDRLDENPAATGWLRTVTTNLCLNHLSRYRARWRFFSQHSSRETATGQNYEERMTAPGSQAEDLEKAGEQQRLERGIRQLPPHQRVPLVLFHFEDRSYREIAGMLDVTLAKVKTDLHRGRLALRRLMEVDDEPR